MHLLAELGDKGLPLWCYTQSVLYINNSAQSLQEATETCSSIWKLGYWYREQNAWSLGGIIHKSAFLSKKFSKNFSFILERVNCTIETATLQDCYRWFHHSIWQRTMQTPSKKELLKVLLPCQQVQLRVIANIYLISFSGFLTFHCRTVAIFLCQFCGAEEGSTLV